MKKGRTEMDTIETLVESIVKICDYSLTDDQVKLIDNLLRNSEWFPDKKDHMYVYKLYKEMKIAAEAELRLLEEQANLAPVEDISITSRISKIEKFLENCEKVISNYTNAFTHLMNSYGDDRARAFYLFYFKGCNAKDVSRELPYIATGTINNWKSQFAKDLEQVKIDT